MPDRWDAEAKDALCCCGRPRHAHTEHCPAMSSRVTHVAALARRAFRAGLEHARGVVLDAAGEYPEDIFRPIETGELADAGPLGDRIAAHMARFTARSIAAAIRREIEGVDPGGQ